MLKITFSIAQFLKFEEKEGKNVITKNNWKFAKHYLVAF
jgi:hypothetical protein